MFYDLCLFPRNVDDPKLSIINYQLSISYHIKSSHLKSDQIDNITTARLLIICRVFKFHVYMLVDLLFLPSLTFPLQIPIAMQFQPAIRH